MSDAEDHIEPSSEIPRGGSSSSQQDSVSALPLTSSIEQPPESADLASTFSLFKDYFDKKLNALKRDIQEDSLSNTDSIAKKLKEESKVSFKFEGNKKQFYFNSDLAEKVRSASTALGKRKLEVVKGYLEEIDADIKKRNKLIRLGGQVRRWLGFGQRVFIGQIGKRFRGRETHSSCRAKSPSQTQRASATEREVYRQAVSAFCLQHVVYRPSSTELQVQLSFLHC